MLGIIGAMDQEVSILKEKMEVKKIDKRASMEFYVGILNGKEVVIVKCGVGKVNARTSPMPISINAGPVCMVV